MKHQFLLSSILFFFFSLSGQTSFETDLSLIAEAADSHFSSARPLASKGPSFIGGVAALQNHIQKNMIYPELAIENSIEGEVVLRLFINEKGQLKSMETVNGLGAGCEKEATRLAHLLPDWEPALNKGEAIPSTVLLKVHFGLW